jgi:hypothetical protein
LVYQTSRFQNKIKEEGGCLTTQNVLWKEKWGVNLHRVKTLYLTTAYKERITDDSSYYQRAKPQRYIPHLVQTKLSSNDQWRMPGWGLLFMICSRGSI